MKKFLLILSAILIAFSSSAAPLTAKQKSDVITKINKSTASVKTISCAFTQTKHLSMLNDKMVSSGKMYFSQPSRLRWEYTSPYTYLFIFNGAKVYVGNKNRKDVIDTNSNKIFKEVARIMMNTVTGKALNDTRDYTIDVADGSSTWNVTLVPRKKDMRRMFSKIMLVFSKSNLMISEINLYEKNNDRTNIKLKNVIFNRPVNESLFAIPK